jgi:hypothetical protein
VARTGADGGILRIDFCEPGEGLEEIDWGTVFAIFEDRRLAFLHQDETADGKKSLFNKFLSRDRAAATPIGQQGPLPPARSKVTPRSSCV